MNYFDVLFAKKLAYNPPLPPVIKRVTGNPIELTDAASAPMVKCITQITGSQDLHGYDKPWVGGAGKNKCNYTGVNNVIIASCKQGVTYTFSINLVNGAGCNIRKNDNTGAIIATLNNDGYNYYTFTADEDFDLFLNGYSSFVANATNLQLEVGSTPTSYEPYSNICPITAYNSGTVSVGRKNLFKPTLSDGTKNNLVYTVQKDSSNRVTGWIFNNTSNAANNLYCGECPVRDVDVEYYVKYSTLPTGISTFIYDTTASSGISMQGWKFTAPANHLVKMGIYYQNNVTLSDFNLKIMISEEYVSTEIEPCALPHTTTYPSAIFRGSEDVVNGEVTTHKIKWTRNSSTMNNSESYPGWNDSGIADLIGHSISGRYTAIMSIGSQYAVNTLGTNDTLFLPTDTYGLTQTEWIALAVDIDIIIELPTPTTSSVTPTNLPIRTLSGYNHIESSTGEMVIDYITDAYQNFVDTVESALPNTRKGGAKALDIFLSLEPQEKPEIKKEEDTKKNIQEEK